MSPVRAARATAVAAERHVDTHTASSAHTVSTTDTVIAHGIDILDHSILLCSALPAHNLASGAALEACTRTNSVYGPTR